MLRQLWTRRVGWVEQDLVTHDLLGEVQQARMGEQLEETGAVVKRVMEGAAHLRVPLTVETGSGANWDEAH